MNHDPLRYCFACRKMKPKKNFRLLSRGPGSPRLVCAECFDRLEKIRVDHLAEAVDRAGAGHE